MAGQRGLSELAASRDWLSNFMKRFNLSIRRRTTTEKILYLKNTPNDSTTEEITSKNEFIDNDNPVGTKLVK